MKPVELKTKDLKNNEDLRRIEQEINSILERMQRKLKEIESRIKKLEGQ